MIPLPPYRPRKVYRVRSLHAVGYGLDPSKTYIRTRHFFSKYYATRSYNWLLKSMTKPSHQWGKVLEVEIRESEVLVFPEDEAQAAGLLDTCQADA